MSSTPTRPLLLLCLLVLSSCSGNPPPRPDPALTLAAPQVSSPYLLQVGDTIGVRFYNNTDLNEELVVRPDGQISLQLIGDVAAAGRTPAELGAALQEAYRGELAVPRVTVIVRSNSGQRIHVGGEVEEAGVFALSGGLTAFRAIQEAGGFRTTAHRKQVILIRRDDNGRAVGYTIDMRPIANGEQPQEDVPLHASDVVFVPRSKIANVNLFVEQYITNNIPTVPVAIPF
jgi:protein involved in polysaccharide export with SLBB domain